MHKSTSSGDLQYSTTRLASSTEPAIWKKCGDRPDRLPALPEGKCRQGEGGLRTKQLYKHSYRNVSGTWYFHDIEEQTVPVDKETSEKIEQYISSLGDAGKEVKELPLISIITAVFNGDRYLEKTIESVLHQTYPNVEYIVIDGGSTDRTLSIIRDYETAVDYWVSERDTGMYDALNKGFSLATGSIYAWLNSDDVYFDYTLRIVSSVFTKRGIDWLTGIPSIINESGEIITVFNAKYYFKNMIRRGFYRSGMLGFIQQDSVFFSRDLFHKAGPLDPSFRLAGDYDLWTRFARHAKLYCVKTVLASFRRRKHQISGDAAAYLSECERVRNPRLKILGLALLPLDILLSPIKCIKPE
ncbi:MAG TPA: glycosyltransferase family 2 protein [Thermodesulfovibrionales bacterium]|nr:glycosyltransferase family 2 protein [Thermodesulfovibrionales bacterium]